MAILTRMVSTTLGGHEGFHQNRRSESTKPDGLKHSAFWSADSIGRSSPNASIMLASICTRTHVPIYVCVFVCVNVFVCVCVETRNRCSQTPRVLETPLPILHNLCLEYICVWHTPVLPNRPGSSSTSYPSLPLSSPISRSRPRDCWHRCAVAIGVQFHFLQSIARNGHEGCHVHLLSVSHDPSVPTPQHTHARI